jgi:hypothetical protein
MKWRRASRRRIAQEKELRGTRLIIAIAVVFVLLFALAVAMQVYQSKLQLP